MTNSVGAFNFDFSVFTDPCAAVEEAAFLAKRDKFAYAVISYRRGTPAQCYAVIPASKAHKEIKILEICR